VTKIWRRGTWWLVLRDRHYWTWPKIDRESTTCRLAPIEDSTVTPARLVRPLSIWQCGPIAVIHFAKRANEEGK
jgi:hypothetical protein